MVLSTTQSNADEPNHWSRLGITWLHYNRVGQLPIIGSQPCILVIWLFDTPLWIGINRSWLGDDFMKIKPMHTDSCIYVVNKTTRLLYKNASYKKVMHGISIVLLVFPLTAIDTVNLMNCREAIYCT